MEGGAADRGAVRVARFVATPLLVNTGANTEIAVSGGDIVTGHDPQSGKELARAHGLNPTKDRNYRIVASPVLAGGLIIAPTRNKPMLALKPGGRGDVTTTTRRGPSISVRMFPRRWRRRSSSTFFATMAFSTLDAQTGAVVGDRSGSSWRVRSSPVLADGKIYVTSENRR